MKPFLTAHWKYLAMLNYEVDPKVLESLIPSGTELDFFEGKTFVSMVAFLFLDTRVLGIPIPFHQNFEEINLRFYVRFSFDGEWRRGVVFIREIVPRAAIAIIARKVYEENYISLPTRHSFAFSPDNKNSPKLICYEWKFQGVWNSLLVRPIGEPRNLLSGSEEEFITEHYWGYTKHKDGSSSEYRVEHPSWRFWSIESSNLECNVAKLYGPQFTEFIDGAPSSAFLAEGSPVTVYKRSHTRRR